MSSQPSSPAGMGARSEAQTSPAREMVEPFEDESDILGGEPLSIGPEEEEGEGEDLFGDGMEADYRPMPALDRYDVNALDEDDYDDMSQGDRVAAERVLDRRDRDEAARRGDLDLIYDESDDEEAPRRKRRLAEKAATGDVEEEEMIESIENLHDTKGHSVKEWVTMLGPKTEIANRFKSFLRNHVNSKGVYVYKDRIRRMCESNHSSFEVEYTVLSTKENTLGYFLPEAPLEMLQIFDQVAKELVLTIYPSYERVTTEIHVRISELPLIEDLRTFRKLHLNQLVRTNGVVTATTGVLPQLSIVKYDCNKCGYVMGPFVQSQNTEVKPGNCPECQSFGPFMAVKPNGCCAIKKNLRRPVACKKTPAVEFLDESGLSSYEPGVEDLEFGFEVNLQLFEGTIKRDSDNTALKFKPVSKDVNKKDSSLTTNSMCSNNNNDDTVSTLNSVSCDNIAQNTKVTNTENTVRFTGAIKKEVKAQKAKAKCNKVTAQTTDAGEHTKEMDSKICNMIHPDAAKYAKPNNFNMDNMIQYLKASWDDVMKDFHAKTPSACGKGLKVQYYDSSMHLNDNK